jgi:ankyrin repeat protein
LDHRKAYSARKGCNLLYVAAFQGHLDIVRFLVNEAKADVNLLDAGSCTPLYAAASKGHLAIVKFLVESEANVFIADTGGWSPLHVAVSNGHYEVLQYLLQFYEDTDSLQSPLYLCDLKLYTYLRWKCGCQRTGVYKKYADTERSH